MTKTDSTVPKGAPFVVFNNALFVQSTLTFAYFSALGWIISVFTPSHYHVDLLGTGAFAVVAYPHLKSSVLRVRLSALAVILWSIKLASFLFYRVLQTHHDARLDTTLDNVSGAVMFWTISWMWNFFCSMPHTLGATSPAWGNTVATMIGFLIFDIGFAIETLADYQKWAFKQTHAPNEFCNVGLWAYSQHPNFFGNLVLWSGVVLMNAPALTSSPLRLACSFLSPLFMWVLFSGQANGMIANAVQLSMERYGHDPAYLEYIETVPKIIPFL